MSSVEAVPNTLAANQSNSQSICHVPSTCLESWELHDELHALIYASRCGATKQGNTEFLAALQNKKGNQPHEPMLDGDKGCNVAQAKSGGGRLPKKGSHQFGDTKRQLRAECEPCNKSLGVLGVDDRKVSTWCCTS
ncbi:hypothetical protein V2G26_003249 [Clonostachys chloroleuca]